MEVENQKTDLSNPNTDLAAKYLAVAYCHAAPLDLIGTGLSVSVLGGEPTPQSWPVSVDSRLFKVTEDIAANAKRAMTFLKGAIEVAETGSTDVLLEYEEPAEVSVNENAEIADADLKKTATGKKK